MAVTVVVGVFVPTNVEWTMETERDELNERMLPCSAFDRQPTNEQLSINSEVHESNRIPFVVLVEVMDVNADEEKMS